MKRLWILVLSAALALAAPAPADAQAKKVEPAKNLDLGLLKQGPKIVSFLCDKGHHNVGVLPFRVRKGARDAGHDEAPLAAQLPGRVENLLIMVMDPDDKKALKVIRDAASHASAQKVGAWTKDKEAFKKLFATEYPLAWGDEKVKPDVFLTGTVSNSGDRTTTDVEIVAFTKDDWSDDVKTSTVATFTVKTDRALLRDLGYSYGLSPDVAGRGKSAGDRDKLALEQVAEREKGKKKDDGPWPQDVGGVRFQVWYGDARQKIQMIQGEKEGTKGPLFQVPPPEADAKVALALTRLRGDKRLGVVVKLNGVSVYLMDERDSLQCPKWILNADDKKPFLIEGFVMDEKGEQVRPFRVLTKKESQAKVAELGDRAGWIDVDVFAAGEEADEEEQLIVSTRGRATGKKPATLADLRKSLLARNNVQMKKSDVVQRALGGLIVADLEPIKGAKLVGQGKLPNPVRIAGVSIRYYDAAAK